VRGPILNMGAANALAAYRMYAGQVPPTSLLALVYMATVSLDRDAEPMWWEGHEILAVRILGASEPVTDAALRAVRRAVTPLFRTGAITVDRHSSAHGSRLITVRYRLWLATPAPDGIRPVHNRPEPADDPPAQDGIRPVDSASTGRFLVEHRTISGRAPDGNRPPEEYEETEERDNTGTAVDLTELEVARARADQHQIDIRAAERKRQLDERLAEIAARRSLERTAAAP
jgi:hypothetical protein